MKNLVILILLLLSVPSFAELQYHSERIKMMDIEVLQQIISKDLKKLENKDESPEPALKEALEILLAQPDQSLAASNIFDQLHSGVDNEKSFYNVLETIVSEAISSLAKKDKSKDTLRDQSTYAYILNNLLAELQKTKEQEQNKNLIVKIRDADIEFSDSLVSHRLLNSMSTIENPSKFAGTIIKKERPWWKFW